MLDTYRRSSQYESNRNCSNAENENKEVFRGRHHEEVREVGITPRSDICLLQRIVHAANAATLFRFDINRLRAQTETKIDHGLLRLSVFGLVSASSSTFQAYPLSSYMQLRSNDYVYMLYIL